MTETIELKHKLEKLEKRLHGLDNFCIAFSGGVDSTFLLAFARRVNTGKLLAVTVASGFVPEKEVLFAKQMAARLNVEHFVIDVDVFANKEISGNPPDRCYHCKKAVFSRILQHTREKGVDTLLHAVNMDDLGDYRPGLEAAKELGVLSPLVEAGLTKNDIRQASRGMGLETWDKPSQSCLATRIPYHKRITQGTLDKIEKAEEFLHDLGFLQVRVRVHDRAARIEVLPDQISTIMSLKIRSNISRTFKEIGFHYVSVDLDGYKTGRMNDEILTG